MTPAAGAPLPGVVARPSEPRSQGVSAFLAGDPVSLEAPSSPGELLRALGLPQLHDPGWLRAGPGVALLHSLTGTGARTALRWVRLSRPTALEGMPEPADLIGILVAPLGEADHALHLMGRLLSSLHDLPLVQCLRRASTREEVVQAFREADERPGEFALPAHDVLHLLRATPRGLAAPEAARRLEACGPNRLERVRHGSMLRKLLEQFFGLFALLLWVAGGFALLAGMPQLGWAIFGVVAINGIFSFLQEYRAERALAALERLLPRVVSVLRDGSFRQVEAASLVPGDVVQIEEGSQVPCDVQILEGDGVRVDQGSLTGESHPVFKLPARSREPRIGSIENRPELLLGGTGVVAGTALCVVRATGMLTEIGRVAHLTQRVREEPSPLHREMQDVTRIVSVLAVGFGLGFFLIGTAAGVFAPREGFLFALGVIVANVPEGLLPTLTLALAFGAQRMARQRCLVRRLSAIEALGATTVICTDKTGTLTENRMSVRWIWAEGRSWSLPDPTAGEQAPVRRLLETAVLASVATAEHGDPTERALVTAAAECGIDAESLRRGRRLAATLPFDSFRKRMTLVHETAGALRASVKGAARPILELCLAVRHGERVLPLDEATRAAVGAEHDRMAAEGMRVLAVAERALPGPDPAAEPEALERELVLIGLVAMWDPPRPEVLESIASCRRAAIRVVMATGDDGLTARAIAQRVGLEVDSVVTGRELARLSPEALRHLVRQAGVLFARVSPAHKHAIVTALMEQGEVVAVTGDGVNDAPALKAADIGVAMGQRGSEVAREAADVVITDDHFASIVAAIRQGRAVYSNVGKFVTYIFASNAAEMAPFLVAVFLGVPLPLTVMQILAVDLGTDLLPALALGAERPEPDVMERPPRSRSKRLLHGPRLAHAYAFLGVIEAALALGAFFWTYWLAGWRPGLEMAPAGPLYHRATTMTFAAIVAAQVGNVFACRTERESVFRIGLASNRFVLWGILAEVGILLALILVPSLARLFGLAPLTFREWGPLTAFPLAVLLLEEGRKAWLRRRHGPDAAGVASPEQVHELRSRPHQLR